MNDVDTIQPLNYKVKPALSGASFHLRVERKEPGRENDDHLPQERQQKSHPETLKPSTQPEPTPTEVPSARYDATGRLVRTDLGSSLTI